MRLRLPKTVKITAIACAVIVAAVLVWIGLAPGSLPGGSSRAGSAVLGARSVIGAGAGSAAGANGTARSRSAADQLPVVVTGAPAGVQEKAGAVTVPGATSLLWGQDADTELPMGSITKVMTALLVIEAGDLNRQIQVPASVITYDAEYDGNSAGLKPGDTLTAQELLEALLLPSGCDAAYTLALAYGPGMTSFLSKMNAEAVRLGMLHTHFTSPDGLPYPTETSTYSTPRDLLTLGQAAMALPAFRAIVSQRNYTLPAGPGHQAYSWANDNELIGSYPGADGIKTGFTNAAGHCLLFEATRNGLTLIGVVLGAPPTGPGSGAVQAAKILDWGFGLPRRTATAPKPGPAAAPKAGASPGL